MWSKIRRKKDDAPLHASVEAILLYFTLTGGQIPEIDGKIPDSLTTDKALSSPMKQPSIKDFLTMLHREFPKLSQEFGPTET